MRKINFILLFVTLFFITSPTGAQISTMDGDSVLCWEVKLWELNDDYPVGFEVTHGDTISIGWKQYLSSTIGHPPQPEIGDTTGLVVVLRLYVNEVSYAGVDNFVDVVYEEYTLSLIPGVWAIAVRSGDMVLNFSIWSDPIWIIVKPRPDMPPWVPVELKIQIIK